MSWEVFNENAMYFGGLFNVAWTLRRGRVEPVELFESPLKLADTVEVWADLVSLSTNFEFAKFRNASLSEAC